MLADDIYNDLGFRVSDRFIILVEAQSTWTANIIIRAFFYLSKTYKDYMDDNGLDIYKSPVSRSLELAQKYREIGISEFFILHRQGYNWGTIALFL